MLMGREKSEVTYRIGELFAPRLELKGGLPAFNIENGNNHLLISFRVAKFLIF